MSDYFNDVLDEVKQLKIDFVWLLLIALIPIVGQLVAVGYLLMHLLKRYQEDPEEHFYDAPFGQAFKWGFFGAVVTFIITLLLGLAFGLVSILIGILTVILGGGINAALSQIFGLLISTWCPFAVAYMVLNQKFGAAFSVKEQLAHIKKNQNEFVQAFVFLLVIQVVAWFLSTLFSSLALGISFGETLVHANYYNNTELLSSLAGSTMVVNVITAWIEVVADLVGIFVVMRFFTKTEDPSNRYATAPVQAQYADDAEVLEVEATVEDTDAPQNPLES